jgi:hypothetical protein
LSGSAEQDRLRAEPARVLDAVHEGLRVTTPVPVITRSVSVDVDVAGRRLRAGQRILLATYRANNLAGGFNLDRAHLPDKRSGAVARRAGDLRIGGIDVYCLSCPSGDRWPGLPFAR